MTRAPEMREEDSPASAAGFAMSDLWMIPLLLLTLMFDRFARHLGKLKAMRRTRPLPGNWQGFYPGLRRCEWAIHSLTCDGVRQILQGEDLDLAALSHDPEPPEDFQPAMPRSALSMHRRMEDIARFHADPERFIRRHAERIAARSDDDDFRRPDPATTTTIFPILRPDSTTTTIFQNAASDGPIAVAIRGPPWLVPTVHCPLPTASLHQRDRALMSKPHKFAVSHACERLLARARPATAFRLALHVRALQLRSKARARPSTQDEGRPGE